MESLISLFEGSDSEAWINSLPSYQRRSIVEMQNKGSSFDDIALTWIAAGASNTAPFSSGSPPPPDPNFLDKLRREVRAFLCGDMKYATDRNQIVAGSTEMHSLVVGSMSSAIAPYLGTTGIIIAPVIVLILAKLGKISLNAWCAVE